MPASTSYANAILLNKTASEGDPASIFMIQLKEKNDKVIRIKRNDQDICCGSFSFIGSDFI